MDGIGKCLAGIVLAVCTTSLALAGQGKKDPNDGMVYVDGVGWLYPDAHCVGREVYVQGHPTGTTMYIALDRSMHDCEHPGQPWRFMGPAKPSPSPATPPVLPARRPGQ